MKQTILGKLNKSLSCDSYIRISDIDTLFSNEDISLLIFGGGGGINQKKQIAKYLKAIKKATKQKYKHFISDEYTAGLIDGYIIALDDIIEHLDSIDNNEFKQSL